MSTDAQSIREWPTRDPEFADPLHELAFLLDVDGTILDIAPTPFDVHAPSSTLRDALAKLGARTGNAVVLVSGRSLKDIDRIFSPLRLPAIGGHGAEMRPWPERPSYRRPIASLDQDSRRQFAAIASIDPGIFVEDKGYAIALHYRLALHKEPQVRRAVAEILARVPGSTLEVLPGKAVIEIKPAGFSKGSAVRELMTHAPFAGRRPIFVGDDTTDETAFAVLPDFGGVGLSVGRTVQGVAGRFGTPTDVRRWIERIASVEGPAA